MYIQSGTVAVISSNLLQFLASSLFRFGQYGKLISSKSETYCIDQVYASNADPDQTALIGADRSGSSWFAFREITLW